MPITNNIPDLVQARGIAEHILEEAQRSADQLRVQHMRAELCAAFPEADTAVFARPWDTHLPRLETVVQEDIELDVFRDGYEDLTHEQKKAIGLADRTILLLGEDENIWSYLGCALKEDPDCAEFRLDLRPDEEAFGEEDATTEEES